MPDDYSAILFYSIFISQVISGTESQIFYALLLW